MKEHRPIDWRSVTTAERSQLYRVLRAIADTTSQNVETLMEQALGGPLLTGADYLSNVRKGKIARAKARLIHAWIAERHAALAHKLAPALFAPTELVRSIPHTEKPARSEVGRLLPDDIPDPILEPYAFTRYVDDHAIEGPLRIISLAPRKGLVQRVGEERRKPTQTLRLGEPFCFEFDSPCEGEAIMLQGYQGRWHPVPLGEQRTKLQTPVRPGRHYFPRCRGEQTAQALFEHDAGPHNFTVSVLAPSPILFACRAALGPSMIN